jgi:hypothetical protein
MINQGARRPKRDRAVDAEHSRQLLRLRTEVGRLRREIDAVRQESVALVEIEAGRSLTPADRQRVALLRQEHTKLQHELELLRKEFARLQHERSRLRGAAGVSAQDEGSHQGLANSPD